MGYHLTTTYHMGKYDEDDFKVLDGFELMELIRDVERLLRDDILGVLGKDDQTLIFYFAHSVSGHEGCKLPMKKPPLLKLDLLIHTLHKAGLWTDLRDRTRRQENCRIIDERIKVERIAVTRIYD